MKHPSNFRNVKNEPSPYFRGCHQGYGRYQWCIKFYGFQSEFEIESAQLWAFGDYSYKTGSFEYLNELLGRTIKASIQGRSGGWLVIDSELTKQELAMVDRHVKACLKGLPNFLKEERELYEAGS